MLKKVKGGLPKVHIVVRGGHSKVHISPQGGRGGQKWPKIGPHGLRMTPYKLRVIYDKMSKMK